MMNVVIRVCVLLLLSEQYCVNTISGGKPTHIISNDIHNHKQRERNIFLKDANRSCSGVRISAQKLQDSMAHYLSSFSYIHVFMDKFVGAYIFVPFHHFTCGGEDDWCRVKVADVPAMGSHLRKILSVMKMVMVLVTKMMMLVVVIALTRGSVNNHVVQFSMLRMHRTLKKKLS